VSSTAAIAPVSIILTTLGADADATAIARALVEERLAACVNVLPNITSVYRWQGLVEQSGEQQLLIKTTADLIDRLETRLKQLHPYEVPEFLVIRADSGSAAYMAWVRESVG
jgi:periplasmic divalent cation tolerance protein